MKQLALIQMCSLPSTLSGFRLTLCLAVNCLIYLLILCLYCSAFSNFFFIHMLVCISSSIGLGFLTGLLALTCGFFCLVFTIGQSILVCSSFLRPVYNGSCFKSCASYFVFSFLAKRIVSFLDFCGHLERKCFLQFKPHSLLYEWPPWWTITHAAQNF